jgi:hypothetical protein
MTCTETVQMLSERTTKNNNNYYEPRAITIQSNANFNELRDMTIKKIIFSLVVKNYDITKTCSVSKHFC